MKWITRTSGWTVLALSVSVLFAPTALGVNYVVDGLDGDDANTGISTTGGENDLRGLDFSNAFKTIGKATSVTAPGDFIFVKAGRYSENVVPTEGTTLIAVGEAIVGGVRGAAFGIVATPDVTIDGFTIEDAEFGVVTSGSSTTLLKKLTISRCIEGMRLKTSVVVVRRCIITDCSWGIRVTAGLPMATIEQCTMVKNGIGIERIGTTIRNNIIAFNGVGIKFLDLVAVSDMDFNDVFGNGTDYSNPGLAGPNDVSVDPQFVDLSRRILHLQENSPLVNAGEKLGGGPSVTIGARDIGHASSETLNAWVDWMDSSGNALDLCSISVADLCIEDASGHIILKTGVNRASVISRVFDGSLKSVEFGALEDLTPASGMRRVIDADDSTRQRELEFRGSQTSFTPTAALPNWNPIFEGQVLDSSFGFVQVRMTLTTNGL